MAITTAQVSATKKSRATQAARNTTRIAIAARVSARVRESKGSAGFSKGRSWLPSFLGKIPWRGMSDYIPVAPAHSSPLSPASAEVNLHACADVDGHQLPSTANLFSFTAALDNHHGFFGGSAICRSNGIFR